MLRIAMGKCGCRNGEIRQSLKPACEVVLSRLDRLRALSGRQLLALPESESELVRIAGKRATLTTYRANLEDGRTLIVVQAIVRTFAWPTYFSMRATGHLVAEGIIVDQDASVTDAPDELLWEYR